MTTLLDIARRQTRPRRPKPAVPAPVSTPTFTVPPAPTPTVIYREVPVDVALIEKLWKEGKSVEEIAKAVGFYRPKSPDPTSTFRNVLTRLRASGWRGAPMRKNQPKRRR
jgi:hypothetical protein